MRVAFVGAHRTGKSTLIEAVADAMPAYEVLDEPYVILEDDGYEHSDPPSVEDFAEQLRVSLESVGEARADVLLDRSPLDFVAYLRALGHEPEDPLLVADVMERLDLVVFVPIEEPDRISLPAHEDRGLRERVDEILRQLVADEAHVVEVSGTLAERTEQVLRAIAAG